MAFAALAALNCSADLLCYEGFSPAGTNVDLASTATGTGFAGGWTNVTGTGGITRLDQDMRLMLGDEDTRVFFGIGYGGGELHRPTSQVRNNLGPKT